MITATVQFLTTSALVNMPCNPVDTQNLLRAMGVLTPMNLIGLDNGRTLKVNLHANDENGERLIQLIRPSDTLGKVNKACNSLYRLDVRQELTITDGIDSGRLKNLDDVINRIDKLKNREQAQSR